MVGRAGGHGLIIEGAEYNLCQAPLNYVQVINGKARH